MSVLSTDVSDPVASKSHNEDCSQQYQQKTEVTAARQEGAI